MAMERTISTKSFLKCFATTLQNIRAGISEFKSDVFRKDLTDLFDRLTSRESLQRRNGVVDFGLIVTQKEVDSAFRPIIDLLRLRPSADDVLLNGFEFFLKFFESDDANSPTTSSREKGRATLLASRSLWELLVRLVDSEGRSSVAGVEENCFSAAWRLIDAFLAASSSGSNVSAAAATTKAPRSFLEHAISTVACPSTADAEDGEVSLIARRRSFSAATNSEEAKDVSPSSLRKSLIRSVARRLVRDDGDAGRPSPLRSAMASFMEGETAMVVVREEKQGEGDWEEEEGDDDEAKMNAEKNYCLAVGLTRAITSALDLKEYLVEKTDVEFGQKTFVISVLKTLDSSKFYGAFGGFKEFDRRSAEMNALCQKSADEISPDSSRLRFSTEVGQLVLCRHHARKKTKAVSDGVGAPKNGVEDRLEAAPFYRGVVVSCAPLLVFAFDYGVTRRITVSHIVARSAVDPPLSTPILDVSLHPPVISLFSSAPLPPLSPRDDQPSQPPFFPLVSSLARLGPSFRELEGVDVTTALIPHLTNPKLRNHILRIASSLLSSDANQWKRAVWIQADFQTKFFALITEVIRRTDDIPRSLSFIDAVASLLVSLHRRSVDLAFSHHASELFSDWLSNLSEESLANVRDKGGDAEGRGIEDLLNILVELKRKATTAFTTDEEVRCDDDDYVTPSGLEPILPDDVVVVPGEKGDSLPTYGCLDVPDEDDGFADRSRDSPRVVAVVDDEKHIPRFESKSLTSTPRLPHSSISSADNNDKSYAVAPSSTPLPPLCSSPSPSTPKTDASVNASSSLAPPPPIGPISPSTPLMSALASVPSAPSIPRLPLPLQRGTKWVLNSDVDVADAFQEFSSINTLDQLFSKVESSLASTIASILNARRDGGVVFGAYGYPKKKVIGVSLGDGDLAEMKREFQRRLATKLHRYFGEAQQNVLSMIDVVFDAVVTAAAAAAAAVEEDETSGVGATRERVIDGLFVIRICVRGSRCKQIIDAPAKGRNGRVLHQYPLRESTPDHHSLTTICKTPEAVWKLRESIKAKENQFANMQRRVSERLKMAMAPLASRREDVGGVAATSSALVAEATKPRAEPATAASICACSNPVVGRSTAPPPPPPLPDAFRRGLDKLRPPMTPRKTTRSLMTIYVQGDPSPFVDDQSTIVHRELYLSKLSPSDLVVDLLSLFNTNLGGHVVFGIFVPQDQLPSSSPVVGRVEGVMVDREDRDSFRMSVDDIVNRIQPKPNPRLFQVFFSPVVTTRFDGRPRVLPDKYIVRIEISPHNSAHFYSTEMRINYRQNFSTKDARANGNRDGESRSEAKKVFLRVGYVTRRISADDLARRCVELRNEDWHRLLSSAQWRKREAIARLNDLPLHSLVTSMK